jgi:chemotaxis protein CheX
MDVRFINPFIRATREVLSTMAATHPVAAKPFLKKVDTAYGDISGIIGITGDALGSMAISFTESCICRVAGLMLHETIQDVTNEVLDTVGEITNMISGVARRALEKEGLSVYAAIPSVVHGRNHQLNHILRSPSIVIPFSAEQGTFVLDVCIRPADHGEKRREDYCVTNVRTQVGSTEASGSSQSGPTGAREGVLPEVRPGKRPPPANEAERVEQMKSALSELLSAREHILLELRDKPFLAADQRRVYKKKLPFLEERIKRLKLDMQALEMLTKLSREDLDSPQITPHYQHYRSKDKPA